MYNRLIEKNEKFFLALFFLYALSLNISKFGISFFGGIIALISILSFKDLKGEKFFVPCFSLFLFGIFLQFFSLGEFKAATIFVYKNYFLLILPLAVYIFNKYKCIEKIAFLMEVSLFIGILKSFYNFYKDFSLHYISYIRVDSFFDVSRWGIILVLTMLLILPRLNKKNFFSWIVFISGLLSLALSNARAPILSLFIGIFIYLLLAKKIKNLIFTFSIIIFLLFAPKIDSYKPIKEFRIRIYSVEKVENGGSAARIFMWKENFAFMKDALKENKKLFFFGTGIKNRETIFKNYLVEKDTYKNLDPSVRNLVSFTDSHNMYLNIFTQTGFIFSLSYVIFMIYIGLKIFFNIFKSKNLFVLSSFCCVVAFCFSGILYGFSFSYETFSLYFILTIALLNYDNLTREEKNFKIFFKNL